MNDLKVVKLNPVSKGRNYGGELEMVSAYNVVAVSKGKILNAITVRCYMGRSRSASRLYCTVWFGNKDVYGSGSGGAGGGGYHKASAAMDLALRAAGVELSASIHGVGDGAMKDAMTALARKLGYRKTVIVSHG